jgi:hypothetical protein
MPVAVQEMAEVTTGGWGWAAGGVADIRAFCRAPHSQHPLGIAGTGVGVDYNSTPEPVELWSFRQPRRHAAAAGSW